MSKVIEQNAKEIAADLLAHHGINLAATTKVLHEFPDSLIANLINQHKQGIAKPRVEIHHLGVFSLKVVEEVKNKSFRNPATGDVILKDVPKHFEIKFKGSKHLNDLSRFNQFL